MIEEARCALAARAVDESHAPMLYEAMRRAMVERGREAAAAHGQTTIGIWANCQLNALRQMWAEALHVAGYDIVEFPSKGDRLTASRLDDAVIAKVFGRCDVLLLEVDDAANGSARVERVARTTNPALVVVRVPLVYLPFWPLNRVGGSVAERTRLAPFADDAAFAAHVAAHNFSAAFVRSAVAFRRFDALGDVGVWPMVERLFLARGVPFMQQALHPTLPMMLELFSLMLTRLAEVAPRPATADEDAVDFDSERLRRALPSCHALYGWYAWRAPHTRRMCRELGLRSVGNCASAAVVRGDGEGYNVEREYLRRAASENGTAPAPSADEYVTAVLLPFQWRVQLFGADLSALFFAWCDRYEFSRSDCLAFWFPAAPPAIRLLIL